MEKFENWEKKNCKLIVKYLDHSECLQFIWHNKDFWNMQIKSYSFVYNEWRERFKLVAIVDSLC